MCRAASTSSLIAILAARADKQNRLGFHGRFTDYPGYDESRYAQLAADEADAVLHICDITAEDFRDTYQRCYLAPGLPGRWAGLVSRNTWCRSSLAVM